MFNISSVSIDEREGYAILRALFWILSISSDCSPVREVCHTMHAYSKMGLITVENMCTISLGSTPALLSCRRKNSFCLHLETIISTWGPHFKLLLTITPNNLDVVTDSKGMLLLVSN